MAIYDSDLLEAIDWYANQGHKVAALVIDEQVGSIPYPHLNAQQHVINKVMSLKCPVWFIELNPMRGDQKNIPTDATIATLVAGSKKRVFTKKSLNAFVDSFPSLDDELKAEKVGVLVIMGRQANCCVQLTAVGGPERPNGPFQKGATGLGYVVLCSDLLIRSDKATWKDEKNVWFYTRVSTLSVDNLPLDS